MFFLIMFVELVAQIQAKRVRSCKAIGSCVFRKKEINLFLWFSSDLFCFEFLFLVCDLHVQVWNHLRRSHAK